MPIALPICQENHKVLMYAACTLRVGNRQMVSSWVLINMLSLQPSLPIAMSGEIPHILYWIAGMPINTLTSGDHWNSEEESSNLHRERPLQILYFQAKLADPYSHISLISPINDRYLWHYPYESSYNIDFDRSHFPPPLV